MHKIFITFCLIVFSIASGYGQTKEEIIRDIKNEFAKINNNKNLKIIKLENEKIPLETTDNGISLTGYFKSDTICKIHAWIGLSFGIRQYEYYLKDNQLFFVYEKEEDFPYDKATGSLNQGKTVPAFEGSYYLYNSKIIDVKSKGQKRFVGKSIMSYKELNTDAQLYRSIIRSHLKKK